MTSSPELFQNEGVELIDAQSVVIYLDCPGSNVVLLQAYFDIYESLGVVRTLDIKESLVCILTTPSMLNDCLEVLAAIQPSVGWTFAQIPSADLKERYLGYTKKGL